MIMMQNEIKGICCEVKNCKFHDKDNCCTAGHITVGTQMATSTSETKCETFESCDGSCK